MNRPTIRLTVTEVLNEFTNETNFNVSELETEISAISTEFSETSIHDIDRATVTTFANVTFRKLGYDIAKNAVDILKNLYDWLIQKKYFVFEHPVVSITIYKYHSEKPVLSNRDISLILSECRTVEPNTGFTKYEYGYPILLMYLTGMTFEKIAVLKWNDIDYDSNHILIHRYFKLYL